MSDFVSTSVNWTCPPFPPLLYGVVAVCEVHVNQIIPTLGIWDPYLHDLPIKVPAAHDQDDKGHLAAIAAPGSSCPGCCWCHLQAWCPQRGYKTGPSSTFKVVRSGNNLTRPPSPLFTHIYTCIYTSLSLVPMRLFLSLPVHFPSLHLTIILSWC